LSAPRPLPQALALVRKRRAGWSMAWPAEFRRPQCGRGGRGCCARDGVV